jgi:23S rRNA (adenine1618-N6)-methyltransferase
MPEDKKEHQKIKSQLHPRNKHRERYDFKALIRICPELAPYVIQNKYNDETINFFDSNAVKTLNRALLIYHYDIQYWNIPENYLCPPIPGRADYIHYIADLLSASKQIPKGSPIKCLDIGVGANCIYPIIGFKEYGWSFVGSDIDPIATKSALKIIEANQTLKGNIEIRLQNDPKQIFTGIIQKEEKFHLTICNPPFHSSAKEAQSGTLRKLTNLKETKTQKVKLNFGGQNNELWCEGGEKQFILRMINESREFASSCLWFTTLVSKEVNLPGIYHALKKAGIETVKTINMGQGNKKSRIVAWTFQPTL